MRKVLIVGLGGTGVEIAGSIARRIQWEYGDLSRVPFVDFFCIDTSRDTVVKTPLNEPRYFHHCTIDQATAQRIATRPEAFDGQNGLSAWLNPDIFRIKNVVEDGTSGVRMLGRVALMLQNNFSHIFAALSEKVSRLAQLDRNAAQEAMGPRFDGVERPVDFLNSVSVYVVATCCGGTGSGTWVDMGYIVRELKKHNPVRSIGILTLPAANEQDGWKKGNAFATLMELNHFSTDFNVYEAKYPGRPEPVCHDNYPYEFPYLVTVDVDRASQGGLGNYRALNETVAQYIYSDTFFDVAAQDRDGRRDDIINFFSSPDELAMSQRFMTFGVSFLTFPAERIMRGCTYKLLHEAFTSWMEDHKASVPATPLGPLQMDTESLYQRLTRTASGSLDARIDGIIDNMVENYVGIEDLVSLEQQLPQAVHEPGSGQVGDPRAPFPSLPAGFVPAVLAMNRGAAASEYCTTLAKHIGDALFDVRRGPSYCTAFLEKLREDLRQLKALPKVSPAEKDRLRQILQNAAEDWLLGFPVPVAERVARRYLEEWKGAAKSYHRAAFREACTQAIRLVYQDLLAFAEVLLTRVTNCVTYLEAGRNRFWALLKDADESVNINGFLLFTPGACDSDPNVRNSATLTREYATTIKAYPEFASMAQDQAEAEAKRLTIAALRPIAIESDIAYPAEGGRTDLMAPRGRSFFDAEREDQQGKLRDWRPDHERLGLEVSRKYFLPISDVSVIDAFSTQYGATEQASKLGVLARLSDWFLPINRGTHGYADDPRKRYHRVFFAGSGSPQPGANLGRFIHNVETVIPPGAERTDLRDDRHNAIFLSEYGAFPLRLIGHVAEWRQFYEELVGIRRRPDGTVDGDGDPNRRKVPTAFSREDVIWVPFEETDRDELYHAEELFLVGLALGEITPLERVLGFSYQPNPHRDALIFKPDLRRSARDLYENPWYKEGLRNTIYIRREAGERDQEIVSLLWNDFLKGKVQVLGLTGVPGTDDPARQRYLARVFLRFISRPGNEGLLRAYETVIDLPPCNPEAFYHEEDQPMRVGDATSPKYPEDGYYCPSCNLRFGATPDTVPQICRSCKTVFWAARRG